MVQEKFKGYIPHITAIALFLLLSAVYFYPQLSGLRLFQSDLNTYTGASKEISDFRAQYGKEPLWTNSMFGGMPAYQISMLNSNYVDDVEFNLFFRIMSSPMLYIFLAMLGFYILLVCFGANPWMSIIGAVAFGLSSLNILYLAGGHNTKVHAIALVPPLLGSLILAYRKDLIKGAILFAFFLCLQIAANHLQMTYYALFLMVPVIITELFIFVREKALVKFAKVSGVLIIAAVLGVLPNLTNMLTTFEYSKQTTRGNSELTITPPSGNKTTGEKALTADYIKEYNFGLGELWSIVIPNVKGTSREKVEIDENAYSSLDENFRRTINPGYWGEQSSSGGAFYFGAAMFVLFILGLIFIKDPIKWAFLAATVIAMLLSLKFSPIVDFFINHFPYFNKFRDTKMLLYLVQISVPIVGILFIKEIFTSKIDSKKLLYSLIAINGIIFIIAVTPGVWFDFISNTEAINFKNYAESIKGNPDLLNTLNLYQSDLESARTSLFVSDCFRTLLFTILISVLLYVFALGKLKNNYLLIAIGFLVIIDIWMVDKRYLNNKKQGGSYLSWVKPVQTMYPFKPAQADQMIFQDEISQNPQLGQKVQEEVSKNASSRRSKKIDPDMENWKTAFRELNFNTNYRVLQLTEDYGERGIGLIDPFANSSVSYFHKSIGGYHGAKLKKYQELIDFYLRDEISNIINGFQVAQQSRMTVDSLFKFMNTHVQTPILNMLNAKYIIIIPQNPPLVNTNANGACWFVNQVVSVDSANQEMRDLGKVNLKTTAIVNKKDFNKPVSLQPDSSATIAQTGFLPNHYTYKSKTASEQMVVFSEIYYPEGWNAYIDGKKTDYFRTDYILRGMLIPAGEHTIEFKFEPSSFKVGEGVSLASSILLILLIFGILGFEIRKNFKK